jgi:hypothetical protein
MLAFLLLQASRILLASLLHIAVIPAVAGALSATLASVMPLFSLLLLASPDLELVSLYSTVAVSLLLLASLLL